MKLTVCIPMYNEEKIIAQTAKTLHSYLTEHFPEDFELIFSDDGSTDASRKIAEELGLSRVKVIGDVKNHGKGYAVRQAMLAAQGDYVLFTDADLAYGTDVLKSAAETFETHPRAGLVIGSRNLSGDGYAGYSFWRRIASKIYIRLLCSLGGFRLSDSQCGCKAFTNVAAKDIFRHCTVDGFSFDFEALLWAEKLGYPILEMPVKIINHRDSKIHLIRDSLKMFRDLLRIRKKVRKSDR